MRIAYVGLATIVAALASAVLWAQGAEQLAGDGLEKVDSRRVDSLYWRPGASLGSYKRVMILPPAVAFRNNWQRDQNRTRRLADQLDAKDMERIREALAREFLDQFKAELEQDNGYEIVSTVGPDVLLVRPAIVNLDVTAPDLPAPGRTTTYVASAGSMTLYVELFDSATNELLGRAMDHREARGIAGNFEISNRITNLAEARRMLRQWAGILRGALDDQWSGGR